jgi:hypothetical protein
VNVHTQNQIDALSSSKPTIIARINLTRVFATRLGGERQCQMAKPSAPEAVSGTPTAHKGKGTINNDQTI